MMKRITYITTGLMIVAFLVLAAHAQDATPTTEPLPTLSRNVPYWHVFPSNLSCHNIGEIAEGPMWGEITIGISPVEELRDYVSTIGSYDSINQYADYISFSRTGSLRNETAFPRAVAACIDIPTQRVTALQVRNNRLMYIQDLVAIYGMPSTITWGFTNTSRAVFWFEEGIAALVNIYRQDPMLEYGQIILVAYFPFQSAENFENRWPYNRTSSENLDLGDEVFVPTPSEAQNPFNFEAMIATITAQPTRTPTPTYAPPSATATATPQEGE